MTSPPQQEMPFSFIGGSLPLDFCNTSDWHSSSEPSERLDRYDDWLAWLRQSRLVAEPEVAALAKKALRMSEKEKETQLQRVIAFRELLFRLFSAAARDEAPASGDLERMNEAAGNARRFLRMEYEENQYIWKMRFPDELDVEARALHSLANEAAELLTSARKPDIRRCEGPPGCGWLFLDHTKNHSRRWCSMRDCGNRAKMRRYQARKKEGSPQDE